MGMTVVSALQISLSWAKRHCVLAWRSRSEGPINIHWLTKFKGGYVNALGCLFVCSFARFSQKECYLDWNVVRWSVDSILVNNSTWDFRHYDDPFNCCAAFMCWGKIWHPGRPSQQPHRHFWLLSVRGGAKYKRAVNLREDTKKKKQLKTHLICRAIQLFIIPFLCLCP